jgi:predicted phosphodiesterase
MKVLIFSDIHANWAALRAVLAAEPEAEKMLCLGDVVAYGPQPVECVQWAMKNAAAAWLLQGNHDRGVAKGEDPRCSPPYRHLAKVTNEFSRRMLSEKMRAFLGKLEPLLSIQIDGASCAACHAAPSDPLFRYLRANPIEQIERELEIAGHPDFLFFGHTHWPMNRRFGKTLVVNPGSVGQPKDGDTGAAYAVWQNGEVALRRAPYDVEETVQALAGTPLESTDVAALAHVLRTGGELPLKRHAVRGL